MLIGLSRDEIIKHLENTDLNQTTKDAIKDLILANNRKIESQIGEVAAEKFLKEMRLRGKNI